MAGVKFTVKYNQTAINKLEKAVPKALIATVDALKTEVEQAQVVPRDEGDLQDSMRVNKDRASAGEVSLRVTAIYAARLYFHPEYNFSKAENPNAKGHWFEDWMPGGSKEEFASQAFAKFYKRYSGV